MFKPIIVIPFFNHGLAFKKMALRLEKLQLPVLLINDGSSSDETQLLNQLCLKHHFFCIHNVQNTGKGEAVKRGFNWAVSKGYTHALQVDADGQHDLNDVDDFLKEAQNNPNFIISGEPVYDETAPKARLYGRQITSFWVFLETGGKLKMDSMCGFRVYPLNQMKKILPILWFNRMGFDIEILVKSFLNKIPVKAKNTKVVYQKDGVSHFRPFKDNFEIGCVHACLCIYSVWKLLTRWRHL